ncbi:MAG TPA: tetratricopeptide repeat protein, partial [Ktedonobacteraceae bacterium]
MEAENKQELMKLATLHYNAGNYDKALETYQKALTIDPIDLRAKHGLARSLASLRRCKEALEEFDWVLRHDGLPNTWYSELYKQRGDVYFEMQIYVNLHDKAMLYDDVLQNFLKALDDYDRALVLNPKNEEAARMRAQVNTYYLQQREKLGKNDKIFGYTPYYKKEASLQSRTNESNQHINNKSAFSKTKEQWLQEGINHYLAEDYTNSLLACEQAIQLDANYARAYYGKGLTLRRCSKDQEALLAFEHAIELDAAYSKAYYGKGNILYKQHRYEEALAVYNYAIHLNPIFAAACSGKGASLIALQRYEEALAAYDQVILLDPDFTITKASFLFEIDRYDEAAIAYDQ